MMMVALAVIALDPEARHPGESVLDVVRPVAVVEPSPEALAAQHLRRGLELLE